MSNQSTFDEVARFLIEQGHGVSSPQYVNGHGAKCAIGCLMTDAELEVVRGTYESVKGMFNSASHIAIARALLARTDTDLDFLSQLQEVHDSYMTKGKVKYWVQGMLRAARAYHLDVTTFQALLEEKGWGP